MGSSDWWSEDKGKSAEMSELEEKLIKEGEDGEEEEPKTTWIREIKRRLRVVQKAEDSCIYKVPSKLRKVQEDAYNPRVVSIGPFHRKNPNLVAALRDHKWRYMQSFLKRTDKCLEKCMNVIFDLDGEVRQCYAENIDEYSKEELAEIMLLDGCFILGLFHTHFSTIVENEGTHSSPKVEKEDTHSSTRVEKEYGRDPTLKSAWMIAALQIDLALLENQIPFFILKHLYDIVFAGTSLPSVAGLALTFFQPMSRKLPEKELGTDYKHLLDLLHKFYFLPPEGPPPEGPPPELPPPEEQITVNDNNHEEQPSCLSFRYMFKKKQLTCPPAPPEVPLPEVQITVNDNNHEEQPSCLSFRYIFKKKQQLTCPPAPDDPATNKKWGLNCCASELSESGIQFQIGSWDDHLLNITFSNGVISIPKLIINEATSSVFRNLIAFEQYSLNSTHGVTSYAFLMKSLIHSSADTKLLGEKGIINHNRIGDHEYLMEFKSILQEVVVKNNFYFDSLRDEVNEYSWCNFSKLHVFLRMRVLREIRLLFSTYFSSTWSFISFLAAAVLLVLTFLQTYYTINPRS